MRETRWGRHSGKVSPWSADDTHIGSRTNHYIEALYAICRYYQYSLPNDKLPSVKRTFFAGQTGNARAKNAYVTLVGCRDFKQLRSAHEILRFHFNARVGPNFWKRVFTCSLCSSVLNVYSKMEEVSNFQHFSS